jgi:hypothetical protein
MRVIGVKALVSRSGVRSIRVTNFARMLAAAAEQAAAHVRLPDPPVLPTRIPPEAVPAAPKPTRYPAHEPDPYHLAHRRDEPYRGLSR